MRDAALSKAKRATKHIREMSNLFDKTPPFKYVLETNTVTHQRSIFTKHNKTVINEAREIAGDAVHNLRAALDYAYFEIVSPIVEGSRGIKNVQFPFSETLERLKTASENRLAHKVSSRFFDAIMTLQPHGEAGGNELLYLIHQIDALDKHRFPIPTCDRKTINGDIVRQQIPCFPLGLKGDLTFSNVGKDITWRAPISPTEDIGFAVFPTTFMFEKKIDVPVDIIFKVGTDRGVRPLIPTLNAMVDVTKETIRIIRDAAT